MNKKRIIASALVAALAFPIYALQQIREILRIFQRTGQVLLWNMHWITAF